METATIDHEAVGNPVELRRMEAGIAAVLEMLPRRDHLGVRCFLMRAAYGQTWDAIAAACRLQPRQVPHAMKRGEHALNDAVGREKITAARLREVLRVDDYR